MSDSLEETSSALDSTHAADVSDLPLETELTPIQARFVEEYIIDLNKSRAAVRVGYGPTTAPNAAARMLAMPHVAAAIERYIECRSQRVKIQQDQVIQEVAALALARVDHYLVDDDGRITLAPGAPPNAMAAIKTVKRRKIVKRDRNGDETITYDVSLELHDKPGQLKLIGRHVGLFPDKVEVSGPGGKPIETLTRIERVIVDPKPGDALDAANPDA